jgi:hypothetical protein
MTDRRGRAMRPGGALSRLPPRIALVGLDEDLADYLAGWLARHWPEARVQRPRPGQRVVADIAIVDREPAGVPQCATLWLADVDRGGAILPLGTRLWRTAMPTTAIRLRRAIEACLDTPGHG